MLLKILDSASTFKWTVFFFFFLKTADLENEKNFIVESSAEVFFLNS